MESSSTMRTGNQFPHIPRIKMIIRQFNAKISVSCLMLAILLSEQLLLLSVF